MKIKDIKVNEILDSRKEKTLEVILTSENDCNSSSKVPKGKSTGSREAVSLGFQKAKETLKEKILPEILNKEFSSISELDNLLLKLDGTKNKSNLGGDLTLGISISFARLLAQENKKELWEVLREEFFPNERDSTPPHIFANMINGGEHADNNLAFQEYMVVAKTKENIKKTKESLVEFYSTLNKKLKKETGSETISLGDEAGFCVNFKNSEEPFFMLEKIIKESFSESGFKIATDIAANSFYKNEKYIIDNKELNESSLIEYYKSLFERLELLFSIEDPFYENNPESFEKLKNLLNNKKIVVGDDLTTTNPNEIEKFKNSINGIIIKANQIGSLTETALAINTAKDYGIKNIISHRSGETDDCFLIHIAKASNAYGVKIGPPQRERILKYNELLRIYG